MAMSAQIEHK